MGHEALEKNTRIPTLAQLRASDGIFTWNSTTTHNINVFCMCHFGTLPRQYSLVSVDKVCIREPLLVYSFYRYVSIVSCEMNTQEQTVVPVQENKQFLFSHRCFRHRTPSSLSPSSPLLLLSRFAVCRIHSPCYIHHSMNSKRIFLFSNCLQITTKTTWLTLFLVVVVVAVAVFIVIYRLLSRVSFFFLL